MRASAGDADPRDQIFVTTLIGQTMTIDIKFDALVERLKDLIHDREGIPQDQQGLIHSGE